MPTPVIVGAARTAIGRSFKGTLVNTPPETLITTVLPEVVELQRRGGGIGVAAMCAGGGQGGAVVIEV